MLYPSTSRSLELARQAAPGTSPIILNLPLSETNEPRAPEHRELQPCRASTSLPILRGQPRPLEPQKLRPWPKQAAALLIVGELQATPPQQHWTQRELGNFGELSCSPCNIEQVEGNL